MSVTPNPTSLRMNETADLVIEWDDGTCTTISPRQMRKACPCATCREKGEAEQTSKPKGLPVMSLAEAQPLRISGMRPVGNYAYNIQFSDGHSSGLFTIDLLHQIGAVRNASTPDA